MVEKLNDLSEKREDCIVAQDDLYDFVESDEDTLSEYNILEEEYLDIYLVDDNFKLYWDCRERVDFDVFGNEYDNNISKNIGGYIILDKNIMHLLNDYKEIALFKIPNIISFINDRGTLDIIDIIGRSLEEGFKQLGSTIENMCDNISYEESTKYNYLMRELDESLDDIEREFDNIFEYILERNSDGTSNILNARVIDILERNDLKIIYYYDNDNLD
jgi:hypothetical protein